MRRIFKRHTRHKHTVTFMIVFHRFHFYVRKAYKDVVVVVDVDGGGGNGDWGNNINDRNNKTDETMMMILVFSSFFLRIFDHWILPKTNRNRRKTNLRTTTKRFKFFGQTFDCWFFRHSALPIFNLSRHTHTHVHLNGERSYVGKSIVFLLLDRNITKRRLKTTTTNDERLILVEEDGRNMKKKKKHYRRIASVVCEM